MKLYSSLLPLVLVLGACLDPIQSRMSTDCVSGTTCQPLEQGDARAVAVGSRHACALLQERKVKCWGGAGLAGDGTRALRLTPVSVRGLTDVTALGAGDSHTCALRSSGEVRCWGENTRGQLGTGTLEPTLEPVSVLGHKEGTVALAIGHEHVCALHENGGVWCWGANGSGQLGFAPSSEQPRPVQVQGLPEGVTLLAAGTTHTCAATADGEAYCWGSNTYGELGDGRAGEGLISGPVRVKALPTPIKALTLGAGHSCALVGSGDVYCWGSNVTGALGDDTALDRLEPVQPVGLPPGMLEVKAGRAFTCALKSSGWMKCWGQNHAGQLGDGTSLHRAAPVEVQGLAAEVSQLSAGAVSTCVALRDGRLQCWGSNQSGQLGDGTQTDSELPVEVVGG